MYRAGGSTSFQRDSRLAECWRTCTPSTRRSPSRPNGARPAAASISAWTPSAPALAHTERTARRPHASPASNGGYGSDSSPSCIMRKSAAVGGFRSFVGVRANEQSAPEAVNRCVDGKRESSPESQAGRSNGLAVLTGEHLAALALRDG